MKADKNLYKTLAPLLDNSGIKEFSIEDAEAMNNLEELLPLFKKSSVNLSLQTYTKIFSDSSEAIQNWFWSHISTFLSQFIE